MAPWTRFLPAAVLGLGALLLARAHQQYDAPLRGSLEALPDTILGHRGFAITISPEEQRVAGVSDYGFRAFTRDSLVRFSVYVGYYRSQTQGKTIHSPKNCLPGLSKCFLLQGIRFLIPSSVAVRLQWLPVIWDGSQSVMKLMRILFQPSEKSCKSNKPIFTVQITFF